MDKIKLLTYSVIGLLILNLSIVAFLFFRPPHRHSAPPDRIIIEKLDFDKDQTIAYKGLIKGHQVLIRDAEKLNMDLKNSFYNQLLASEQNFSLKDSLVTKIAENQKQIELINYNHFNDIQKICRPEQMPAFKELIRELSKIFNTRMHR